EADLAPRGVTFVYVNVDASDTAERCQEHIAKSGFKGAYLLDRAGEIASALEATTTTETFVLDAAGTLQYRGAVSDQYGIGWSRAAPRTESLRAAVEAVLDGRRPATRVTAAPGCALERRPAPKGDENVAAAVPTYHARVSRIISESCLDCHRAGGVGP